MGAAMRTMVGGRLGWWLALALIWCGCADDGGSGDCPGAVTPDAGDQIEQPVFDSRVVAIGDLHGDLAQTLDALCTGGLIDVAERWIGGNTTLVQTGDILDRGDDERAIIELFDRLAAEAEAAGGAVVRLNGNHEIITVDADYRYVTEAACDGFADLEGLDLSQPELSGLSENCKKRGAAFLPGGSFALKLAEQPVVAVVEGSAFVHGGLFAGHLEYGLDRVNHEVRAWMRGEQDDHPGPVGSNAASLVWNRTYSDGVPSKEACDLLEETLVELGAERLVVGHTVQAAINPECDDLVWRIDTGMSAYYEGVVQVLEILDGEPAVLGGTG